MEEKSVIGNNGGWMIFVICMGAAGGGAMSWMAGAEGRKERGSLPEPQHVVIL
jgi:hypothetical protein